MEGDAAEADQDGPQPQRPMAAAEGDDDESHHVQHDPCAQPTANHDRGDTWNPSLLSGLGSSM